MFGLWTAASSSIHREWRQSTVRPASDRETSPLKVRLKEQWNIQQQSSKRIFLHLMVVVGLGCVCCRPFLNSNVDLPVS